VLLYSVPWYIISPITRTNNYITLLANIGFKYTVNVRTDKFVESEAFWLWHDWSSKTQDTKDSTVVSDILSFSRFWVWSAVRPVCVDFSVHRFGISHLPKIKL
jgi:hypothetical protein